MSEVSCLFGEHPFLAGLLLLCASPAFITFLVLFSPILVTFLLFTLGIAGLARSRRRLRQRSSRRRRKNNPDTWTPGGHGLEDEKQRRVDLYLEDQLRNLVQLQGSDIWNGFAVGDAQCLGDGGESSSTSSRLAIATPDEDDERWPRSDVSEAGGDSEAVLVGEDD